MAKSVQKVYISGHGSGQRNFFVKFYANPNISEEILALALALASALALALTLTLILALASTLTLALALAVIVS